VLVCAECGWPSELGAAGWRALWTDDEPPAVLVFCPECRRARVRRRRLAGSLAGESSTPAPGRTERDGARPFGLTGAHLAARRRTRPEGVAGHVCSSCPGGQRSLQAWVLGWSLGSLVPTGCTRRVGVKKYVPRASEPFPSPRGLSDVAARLPTRVRSVHIEPSGARRSANVRSRLRLPILRVPCRRSSRGSALVGLRRSRARARPPVLCP
jgi:hypothetical protein